MHVELGHLLQTPGMTCTSPCRAKIEQLLKVASIIDMHDRSIWIVEILYRLSINYQVVVVEHITPLYLLSKCQTYGLDQKFPPHTLNICRERERGDKKKHSKVLEIFDGLHEAGPQQAHQHQGRRPVK